MNFPNLHFIIFFFFFFESILLEETLVRDLLTIFSLNFFSIYFSVCAISPASLGVAPVPNSDSVPLLLPLPFAPWEKPETQSARGWPTVQTLFFSSFPASHSRRHKLTTQVSEFVSPRRTWIVCLFFCSGRFFGQSLGPFISVDQTVSASGIECESSDLKNFNQDKRIATSAQVAMDAVKSPEANR